MQKITLKINTRDKKGKYLLGLIRERTKEGNFIEIESTVMDEITIAMEQVKKMQAGELPKRSVKQMLKDK